MVIRDECMDSIIKDIRFAIRKLLKHPGFTLIAVLTLGLGIGATTAIFSAVNPVLLEPLPYPSANRLITISYAVFCLKKKKPRDCHGEDAITAACRNGPR